MNHYFIFWSATLMLSCQHTCLQDCGQTGPLLAGLLNAPQATFAANIERGDDGSFTVERETDTGEYE